MIEFMSDKGIDEGRNPTGLVGLVTMIIKQAIEDYIMLRDRGVIIADKVVSVPNIKDAYTTENQVYALISFMQNGEMQAYLQDAGITVHADFILRHLGIPKRTAEVAG